MQYKLYTQLSWTFILSKRLKFRCESQAVPRPRHRGGGPCNSLDLTLSAGDSSVDQSKPDNDTAVNTQRSGSGYPSMYDVTPFPIQMADTNFPSQLAQSFMRCTTYIWLGFRITITPLTRRIYKERSGWLLRRNVSYIAQYFTPFRCVSEQVNKTRNMRSHRTSPFR